MGKWGNAKFEMRKCEISGLKIRNWKCELTRMSFSHFRISNFAFPSPFFLPEYSEGYVDLFYRRLGFDLRNRLSRVALTRAMGQKHNCRSSIRRRSALNETMQAHPMIPKRAANIPDDSRTVFGFESHVESALSIVDIADRNR